MQILKLWKRFFKFLFVTLGFEQSFFEIAGTVTLLMIYI